MRFLRKVAPSPNKQQHPSYTKDGTGAVYSFCDNSYKMRGFLLNEPLCLLFLSMTTTTETSDTEAGMPTLPQRWKGEEPRKATSLCINEPPVSS